VAAAGLAGQEMAMPPVEVGLLTLPRGQGDPAVEPHPSHKLLLRDAQQAERLGFGTVWIPDHFYMERPNGLVTFPDCWTLMTAVAMTTERVRVGSMVMPPGFRHPARLAKMAGALQELSDGRLILGLGAGNQPHEHDAFDLDFAHRVGRFKEYLAVLTELLRGETVTRGGRYYTLRQASLRTAVPRLPIWIAAGGEQMFELTARYADGWNAAGAGWDLARFAGMLEGLSTACRAVGRDLAEIAISHQSFVAPVPDAAAAGQLTEALADEWRVTPEQVGRRFKVGTPDQVAAAMRQLVDAGVQHFVCVVPVTPSPERYWERVELLAREVVPRLAS
jgi:alkanesulfonate monooxygenase SsuD/methylene tetrahydromethanopterin reductase-like flavin-dependent oxidoreductase (luciferase family)